MTQLSLPSLRPEKLPGAIAEAEVRRAASHVADPFKGEWTCLKQKQPQSVQHGRGIIYRNVYNQP